ncbi:interleukin-17B [Gastrophryne carolinensis]
MYSKRSGNQPPQKTQMIVDFRRTPKSTATALSIGGKKRKKRELKKEGLSERILNFHNATISPVLCFSLFCWFARARSRHWRKRKKKFLFLYVTRADSSGLTLHQMLLYACSLLLAIAFSLEPPKASRNRKKGHGKAKENSQDKGHGKASPDPVLGGNSFAPSQFYSLVEEYEQSLTEMVNQLKNHSESSGGRCEVNLRLWLSNRRSLSPWTYSINHDENRIPASIPEARCLCSGCINPFTMQEDLSMSSIPIYSKIPVRRRLCDSSPLGVRGRRRKKCHKEYTAVMENIAVGCTCIF